MPAVSGERSKPAYQVFSYTISPTHLHFLYASSQEDIVRLETLPRQPIPLLVESMERLGDGGYYSFRWIDGGCVFDES